MHYAPTMLKYFVLVIVLNLDTDTLDLENMWQAHKFDLTPLKIKNTQVWQALYIEIQA